MLCFANFGKLSGKRTPGIVECLNKKKNFEKRFRNICIPGKSIWVGQGLSHIMKRATAIEYYDNKPTIKFEDDSTITSDCLVLAHGSISKFKLSSWRPSPSVRSYQERMAELYFYREKLLKSFKIVVIGGGVVGVEMVCTIADEFPEKQIFYLVSGPRLLEGMPSVLGVIAKNNISRRKNVKLYLDQGNVTFTEDGHEVTLKDGRIIEYDLLLPCIGTSVETSIFPSIWVKNRQVNVNKFGCVVISDTDNNKFIPNVFAVGDCCNQTTDKSAKAGLEQVKAVLRNIQALALGGAQRHPTHYFVPPIGFVVTLGNYTIVVEFGILRFVGFTRSGSSIFYPIKSFTFYRLALQIDILWQYFTANRDQLIE